MNEREILMTALEIEGADAREQYLDQACGPDQQLRKRVESLLRSSDAVEGFLETPAPVLLGAVEEDRPLPTSQASELEQLPGKALGDFRIIRELGRGGMGVVYEAEQLSLGRRVALKVLPFAALLDKRQLERFKTEARAAAMLKHTNIVSVYHIGCERGMHYYAMELVEGQGLDKVLEGLCAFAHTTHSEIDAANDGQLDTNPVAALSTNYSTDRQSYYRRVAEFGVQTCHALSYAHHEGVIHRDIKPSNLLLDEEGQLHVADFGIARIQSNETLTASGDVVGTLRYMSPERASGHHGVCDHRTDIYSLGVTLYELLALRPAFDHPDRQGLLHDVLEKQPSNLHSIDAAIPYDLETIILKACAKDVMRRYPSADELRDDLQRFIDQRPIQARRGSAAYYVRQWARRNRVTAALLIAVLSLGLLLAVLGPLFAVKYALLAKQESEARQAAGDALAQSNSDRQRLQQVFDDVINDASALAGVVGADEVQRRMLLAAKNYYDQSLRDDPDNSDLQLEAASSFFLLARYYKRRGHDESVRPLVEQSLELLNLLHRADPDDPRTLYELAKFHGTFHLYSRDGEKAEAFRREGLEFGDRLMELEPDNGNYWIAHNWFRLRHGFNLHGRVEESIGLYQLVQESYKQFPDNEAKRSGKLLGVYGFAITSMARVYHLRHEMNLAEKEFKRAISVQERQTRRESKQWRVLAAGRDVDYARLLRDLLRPEEATARLRAAIADIQPIVKSAPEYAWAQSTKFYGHVSLALAPRDMGDDQAALEALNAAFDTDFAKHPNSPRTDAIVADGEYLRGQVLWSTDQQAEATEAFRNAILWAESCESSSHHGERCLATILTTCPESELRDVNRAMRLAEYGVVQDWGWTWQLLGLAACEAKQWQKALDALAKATELRNGGDAVDWLLLARIHANLGNKEEATRFLDQAIEGKDGPIGHWNLNGPEVEALFEEVQSIEMFTSRD